MKKILVSALAILLMMPSCKKEDAKDPHNAIDLGLSVLWAETNIGAQYDYQFGWYANWGGERAWSHFPYAWDHYQFCEANEDGSLNHITKYTNASSTVRLLSEDDTALKSWGKGWRMPTKEECEELINSSVVSWHWVQTYQINDEAPKRDEYFTDKVSGFMVTNDETGACIFLPAAMMRQNGSGFYHLTDTYYGYYWTKDLATDDTEAYAMMIGRAINRDNPSNPVNIDTKAMKSYLRCYGLSIRPVKDKKK